MIGPIQPDVDAAKAQVANAQAGVEQAKANLDAAALTAPFDGTVASINGTAGQYISGGSPTSVSATTLTAGDAVVTLVDLNNLQVTAQVNEADIGKVKVGDPVTFAVSAFPTQSFTGKVLGIQPAGTVAQNVVNYNVMSSIQSTTDANMYPGMTATATIVSAQSSNVVLVPTRPYRSRRRRFEAVS